MKRFFTRLVPKDLTGQLILLLLAALIAAQAVSFQILHDERRLAQRTVFKSQVLERIAAASRLLAYSPVELRPQILQALQTENLRFWIASEPSLKRPQVDQESALVQKKLENLLPGIRRELRLYIQTERSNDENEFNHPHMRFGPQGMGRGEALPPPEFRGGPNGSRNANGKFKDHSWRRCIDPQSGTIDEQCLRYWRTQRAMHDGGPQAFVIAASASILLPDGLWLNVETSLEAPAQDLAVPTMVTFALSALFIVLVVIYTVKRITRPMNQLATAAESLGRGESVADLKETGPASFRATTRAFNLMNRRLQRYVNDRMQFLAAVSHDLRTPLTSLRLRTEFIDDEETRTRILATIEEMTQMIDGVLAFVREDTQNEAANHVDMTSLVESVCDDFSDLGRNVTFREPDLKFPPISCRPLSIKRALRNLIDNALKYGKCAEVSISQNTKSLDIHIDDKGPGLSDEDIERIFDPFVRLEGSRNKETGGVGLGLSIAQTIAQSHGGSIRAGNRPDGGLRMTVHLPL